MVRDGSYGGAATPEARSARALGGAIDSDQVYACCSLGDASRLLSVSAKRVDSDSFGNVWGRIPISQGVVIVSMNEILFSRILFCVFIVDS